MPALDGTYDVATRAVTLRFLGYLHAVHQIAPGLGVFGKACVLSSCGSCDVCEV